MVGCIAFPRAPREPRQMRPLHRTLPMFSLSAGVVVAACFAVLLGAANDARRQPIDGLWRAEFLLDTAYDDHQPTVRQATVRGTLLLGKATYAGVDWDGGLWVTVFDGSHMLRFEPIIGQGGADDGHLSAGRIGRDSVLLGFGLCSDCGSLYGRARIVADTIAGAWRASTWGEGRSGRFRLVRVRRSATWRDPILPRDTPWRSAWEA
jgi:hypothetical protein